MLSKWFSAEDNPKPASKDEKNVKIKPKVEERKKVEATNDSPSGRKSF